MFPSLTLLALLLSASTAVGDRGAFCDPSGLVNASETASTSWGAGLDTGTTGLKGTAQTFRYEIATQTEQVNGRVLLRVPWTLTTQAPAGAQGAIQATITITPPGQSAVTVSALGAVRNLNSANGTQFVELIALDFPSGVTFTPGTTVDVTVQPTVTIAAAGATLVATLRHNPAVSGDQLVAEFQGMQGVS